MRKQYRMLILSCIIVLCNWNSFAQKSTILLEQIRNEFLQPSNLARTKLWWFHGETETTREGITADLEAFKREGIGGVVYYDQNHGKGENALLAFSKEWWEMFRFAASEAKRLGLTFETHLSNGYVSGGPWITEELSMQRLEASDTMVFGNQHFIGKLPMPKSKSKAAREVAVVAFPVLEENWQTSLTQTPEVSTNITQLDEKSFVFPKDTKLVPIPAQPTGMSVFINLVFSKVFTARSITYCVRPKGKSRTGAMNMPGPSSDSFYGYGYVKQPDLGQLEVSNDGINYTKVCDLKPMYESPTWNQRTLAFPAIQGKYFRLNLHDWNNPKDIGQELSLGNIVLSSQAKMNQWEELAALNSEYIEQDLTPEYTSSAIINPKQLVDLTAKMGADGQLDWNVPAGKWIIMRFVRASIGVKTKHGRANLTGLESDKLSATATKVQWNSYFNVMLDSLKKVGISLKGLHMDSHEAGSQNWTAGFEHQFKQRRGYDIHTYLPALAGYIVGSKAETSGFLYDMRLTLSDLVSDQYFGTLDSLCRQAGVVFTAQAVGNGLTMVADNFKAKGRVEKPQGEFWGYQTHGSYDVKETSAAAHIYGKPIASAEAFTDMKFSQSLADMKNVADYAYAFGAQEFVVCASAYQPWLNKIPGSTGGGRQYGLNRNNTYWNYSRPFWDYQARCAGLMRNGLPVIDLCVYLGENPPVKLLAHRLPEIPEGYDFDVCTEEALLSRMSSENGRIILPDGMSYQLLVLEKQGGISLSALRKMVQLVKEGAALYGTRPVSSGSLHDAPYSAEYQALANQLWGNTASGSKTVGKGIVYWGMPLSEAIAKRGIKPDIGLKSGNTVTDKVYFAHRKVEDTDIYFLNNHSKHIYQDTIRLRTNATHAEYWNPVTGKQYALAITTSGKAGLLLNVSLQPNESGFIITTQQMSSALPIKLKGIDEKVTSIEGDWKVFFEPKWGGAGEVTFTKLVDWTKHEDNRIKYYSGTAVYRKTIQVDTPALGEQFVLRFPQLSSIARVFVNGKEVSTVWCSPWEATITPYLKQGQNELEIHVVNSLTNRMIGDASLPQSERVTYAYPDITSPKDHLVSSGIIDKVLLVKQSK